MYFPSRELVCTRYDTSSLSVFFFIPSIPRKRHQDEILLTAYQMLLEASKCPGENICGEDLLDCLPEAKLALIVNDKIVVNAISRQNF